MDDMLTIAYLAGAKDADQGASVAGWNAALDAVADELSRTEQAVHAALAQRDYDKAWTIAECVRDTVLAMKKGGDA